MNDAEKSKLEQELKKAAPVLNRLSDGPSVLPDHVRARLNTALDKKFPLVRELTAKQMEGLLLKLIAEQPADGFELINNLGKAKFKLQGGTEGMIYGILSRLEHQGSIEGRWRESSAAMTKSYHLTSQGTKLMNRELASAGELQGWANLVLGKC
ncbi:MAG: PadR family transcriptional regulator [Limisphaerales bacterium]